MLITLTLTACGPSTAEDENVIYVTVYPMQYLIEEIAGDTVTVKRVPGSQVHADSYDWTAKELIDMLDANLLFYINAGVDNYIPNNEDKIFSDGDVQLVDMSQHIEYAKVCYEHTHEDEDEHADEADDHDEDVFSCDPNSMSDDPHFWLDPVRMSQAAEFVKDKLIATFPENVELYENNHTVLSAALSTLNDDFQDLAETATKPLITTILLFSYWEDRYGFEILSITNDLHSSEANPSDIIDYVNHAIEDNVHYILFEKNTNSPAGESVLQELRLVDNLAQPRYLHGLGNLTNDEIETGANYISVMYDNLAVLIEAQE
jgi:zinc transport system substrate-binding protein